MAVSYAYSGALQLAASAKVTLSGDITGAPAIARSLNISFAAAVAPIITGFVTGVATVTTSPTNILLAHATNILSSLGTAVYSDGFTVAGAKVKFLMFENLDGTNSVTVKVPASNGFALLQTANTSLITMGPGDVHMFYIKAGSAALTTGSNDALALTASAGTPTMAVTVLYGS